MPAFDESGQLDLHSTANWVNWLIDEGIKLFWTTHGTSHFFCLSDEETAALTRTVAEVTAGRAVFIASTAFHWSAGKCVEFIEKASLWGVDAIKLQVDWAWSLEERDVLAHYQAIADRSTLPLFGYSLAVPGVSGGISQGLLMQLLEIDAFVGMKNDAGDFYEHTTYLQTIRQFGRGFHCVTGGSMESQLHGRHFGSRVYAAAIGMILPRVALAFDAHLERGEFEDAVRIIRDIEQPLDATFNAAGRWAHWSAYHVALHRAGHFASPTIRLPLKTLTSERVEHIEIALSAR